MLMRRYYEEIGITEKEMEKYLSSKERKLLQLNEKMAYLNNCLADTNESPESVIYFIVSI